MTYRMTKHLLQQALTIWLFSFCASSCRLDPPNVEVNQTCYVTTVWGKPLAGREVNLESTSIIFSGNNAAVTDATGKTEFKFTWEEYHESGQNTWTLKTKADNVFMPTTWVRDPRQYNSRKINPDTIKMDSIVDFRVRFKIGERINAFSVKLNNLERDKFFEIPKKTMTPIALDTIITFKVFKRTAFEIYEQHDYADRGPVTWNNNFYTVPANFPRDSIFIVAMR